MSTYYIEASPAFPGRFNMRQERYRVEYEQGNEHPHDLMAVGFTALDMRKMIAEHFAERDIDTSVLPTE